MKSALLLVCIGLGLGACASRADNVTASYVSSNEYTNWSCAQIAIEAGAISHQLQEATVKQNNKAVGDAVATGVALVVFWPAAFLISGDGASAANLANLKGRAQAIESASRQKNCQISFQRPAA